MSVGFSTFYREWLTNYLRDGTIPQGLLSSRQSIPIDDQQENRDPVSRAYFFCMKRRSLEKTKEAKEVFSLVISEANACDGIARYFMNTPVISCLASLRAIYLLEDALRQDQTSSVEVQPTEIFVQVCVFLAVIYNRIGDDFFTLPWKEISILEPQINRIFEISPTSTCREIRAGFYIRAGEILIFVYRELTPELKSQVIPLLKNAKKLINKIDHRTLKPNDIARLLSLSLKIHVLMKDVRRLALFADRSYVVLGKTPMQKLAESRPCKSH